MLSAKRVGPSGKVYGLDMTDEMLALAIRNRDQAGATNVEFLKGYIEEIPLPAGTVDVVISNCVVNLSTDKGRVFAEMFRVLRDGGRIGITDVVADDELSPAERDERGSYVGCIAGALSFSEFEAGLRAAGFEAVRITSTHEPMPGIHSAIVQATRGGNREFGHHGEHSPPAHQQFLLLGSTGEILALDGSGVTQAILSQCL